MSGLDGYAVAVDSFPNTNPCETSADPDPATCVASEITHPVSAPRERSLASVPDGSSWIHIAAASGAGLRSTGVTHVEIRADRTDPTTRAARGTERLDEPATDPDRPGDRCAIGDAGRGR